MPKDFEYKLKELASSVTIAGKPKMTEEMIVVQGLLALIIDIQLRHKRAANKGST